MIGTAFLAVGFWRLLAYHLTDNHHLGLESGILTDTLLMLFDYFYLYLFIIEDHKNYNLI